MQEKRVSLRLSGSYEVLAIDALYNTIAVKTANTPKNLMQARLLFLRVEVNFPEVDCKKSS